MIYVYLLCEIYKNGYYIQVDDDLEYIIASELGVSVDKVKQVLNFLLKKSLFDSKLFSSDKVLTSAGIQKRFQLAVKERARKNPIEVGRYWLLEKEATEPFIKCTLFEENPGNACGYSGKNPEDSENKYTKKSKVNKKDIYKGAFSDSSLESAFQFYLLVRSQNWGEISEEQVNALREDLLSLSSDLAEQKAILNKAAAGGWKNLYPVQSKRRPKTKKQPEKQGKFKNFEEREYEDMTDLTRKLMQR
nr:MAG TPA: protein of unknown function (DUF4373) [Caudoviricetes sp.]